MSTIINNTPQNKIIEISMIGYLLTSQFINSNTKLFSTIQTTPISGNTGTNSNNINNNYNLSQHHIDDFDRKLKEKIENVFKSDSNEIYKECFYIQTYTSNIIEGISRISNKIELHKNQKLLDRDDFVDSYTNEFYSEVSPYVNYGEYLKYTNCFIKYISHEKLPSKIGFLRRVEFCRCENSFDTVLETMGYRKSDEEVLKQDSRIYKHYEYNIYLKLFKIGKIGDFNNIDAFEIFSFFNEEDNVTKELISEKFIDIKNEFNDMLFFV